MQKLTNASARGRIIKIIFSVSLALSLGIAFHWINSTERKATETNAENDPALSAQAGPTSKQLSEANGTDAETLSAQLTRSVEADSAAEERNMLEAGALVADAAPARTGGNDQIQREAEESLRLQKQQEGEVTADGEDLY